jgi:hypothetical protein
MKSSHANDVLLPEVPVISKVVLTGEPKLSVCNKKRERERREAENPSMPNAGVRSYEVHFKFKNSALEAKRLRTALAEGERTRANHSTATREATRS